MIDFNYFSITLKALHISGLYKINELALTCHSGAEKKWNSFLFVWLTTMFLLIFDFFLSDLHRLPPLRHRQPQRFLPAAAISTFGYYYSINKIDMCHNHHQISTTVRIFPLLYILKCSHICVVSKKHLITQTAYTIVYF